MGVLGWIFPVLVDGDIHGEGGGLLEVSHKVPSDNLDLFCFLKTDHPDISVLSSSFHMDGYPPERNNKEIFDNLTI